MTYNSNPLYCRGFFILGDIHMAKNTVFISQDLAGISVTPRIIGGLIDPTGLTSQAIPLKVNSAGELFVTASLSVGDIQIGAVELKNATTDDRAVVNTSGELSVLAAPSSTSASAASFYFSTALESGSQVKASAGVLYGVSGYNSGSRQWVHIFNSATQPANGAIPFAVIRVAGDNNFAWDTGKFGIPIDTGIYIANSTTAATLTSASADCWFNAAYK